MTKKLKTILLIAAGIAIACFSVSASDYSVRVACSFPADTASLWPHGTAGAFIGNIDGGRTVIIAGGSDFPGLRPWEGGKKAFSDSIWELTVHEGKYNLSAVESCHLPSRVGQGCSASDGRTLFCIGGLGEDGPCGRIFTVTRVGENLKSEVLCDLPERFIPCAAAFHEGAIYIHGTSDGRNSFYRFSPASKTFSSLQACPERILYEGSSLCRQHNGREEALYLIGGRGTDSDGLFIAGHVWEYLPSHDTWSRKCAFSNSGEPLELMYSPAINFGASHIIVFGGDDGVEMRKRLQLEKEGRTEALKEAFLSHPGFNAKIYAYHTITDTWTELGTSQLPLPAVTTAVMLDGKVILPSGEAHPGVRSADILEVEISDQPSFGILNYSILAAYLLIMLGIGFYFSRKNSGTEKFFKGGGKIPWWAAGISIFATTLSAITFLSMPAKAYATDWGMFMFNMTIILIVPLVIHFYLPLIKKLNVASVYQYLEERFSPSMKYLASAFFCLFMFARIAIILFLPSLALNAVTGINIYTCILLMGVVTIIYSTLGGIEAVVWGDVVQGFLLVGGAILSLVWIICHIDGGLGGFFNVAIDADKFHILNFALDWTQPVFWVAIVGGVANQLLTYTSDQSVVQKYLTVKDTAGTKRGIWLNGILSVPVTILFFLIGTALFVFFRQEPQLLDVGMTNTDSIFPHYIMCQLPKGVAGLLIAAVFAAAMSTLSSNINSSTTVMSVDFFSRIRKGCTDEEKVRFARIAGIIVGGLGVIMALVLASSSIYSLWDQFNFYLGLLTSGVGGLFAMGIFTRRIGTRSALAGFAGSLVIVLLCHAHTHISPVLYGFIGLVSCFVIGYLASFIFGYRK